MIQHIWSVASEMLFVNCEGEFEMLGYTLYMCNE